MKKNPVISKARVYILIFALLSLIAFIVARVGFLYFDEAQQYLRHGDNRSLKKVTVPADKGMIKGRNGEILAITTVLYSLIVDLNHLRVSQDFSKGQARLAKKRISEFKSKMSQLAKILGKTEQQIEEDVFMQSPKRIQTYLAKDLIPEQISQITELEMPALVYERKLKRYYPYGAVLANLIGFSDYVEVGKSGIEKSYNQHLQGKNGTMLLRRDRVGNAISYIANDNKYQHGKNLTLTIDTKIQDFAFFALQEGLNQYLAKKGAAVVLNAKTGEILAMVSLPSYNTNDYAQRVKIGVKNIAIQDLFEPGSIVKPFLALAALEANKIKADSKINLGDKGPKHQIKIANKTFKDSAPIDSNNVSIATVLKKSSNVGAIRLSKKLSQEQILATYRKVGLGQPLSINLYGSKFRGVTPKQTTPLSKASLAIGYGLNASVLQIARAYTVFANNGKLLKLRLTKDDNYKSTKVSNSKHINLIASWLRQVTDDDGTGKKAQISGFDVAGKTSTTLLSQGKQGYKNNKYLSSFVGMAPFKDPKIIVAVLVIEPRGKDYYGGDVAAPIFSQIAAKTLNYLGIKSEQQKPLISVLEGAPS